MRPVVRIGSPVGPVRPASCFGGEHRSLPSFAVEELIVARHGESDYSARGLLNGDPSRRCGLTPTGRQQARRLGERLRGRPVDLCVTSAFARTKETAAIALAGRAIPTLVIPELNDHAAGEFEGRTLTEYLTWAHAAASSEPIPGASESRLDALGRLLRGYRQLLDRPERTIVAILHSLPISYLVSGPLQRVPLLEYAEPIGIGAADVRAAIERLEKWAAAPTW
jgi:broad specificity phosphatase PhoE